MLRQPRHVRLLVDLRDLLASVGSALDDHLNERARERTSVRSVAFARAKNTSTRQRARESEREGERTGTRSGYEAMILADSSTRFSVSVDWGREIGKARSTREELGFGSRTRTRENALGRRREKDGTKRVLLLERESRHVDDLIGT